MSSEIFDADASLEKLPHLLSYNPLAHVLQEVILELQRLRKSQADTTDKLNSLSQIQMAHAKQCENDRTCNIIPRLEISEERLGKCLRLNDHTSEPVRYFCRRTSDENGDLSIVDERVIVDSQLVEGLNKRFEHYKNYRIKDLKDGKVLRFERGFMMSNTFFMAMLPNAGAAVGEGHRVYRLEGTDAQGGREAFKIATPQEKLAVERLDIASMQQRSVLVNGERVPATLQTEIIFEGNFFQVFETAPGKDTLQDLIEVLQQQNEVLQAKLEREISSHLTSQDRISVLEARVPEVQSGVDILSEEKAEIAAEVSTLKSNMEPRVRSLETQIRRVLNLEGDPAAGLRYIFCELRPDGNCTNVAELDGGFVDSLQKRLFYYLNYRHKDLDGRWANFARGFILDGKFFVALKSPMTSTLRVYRRDRVDANNRDILKPATAEEKAQILALSSQAGQARHVKVGDHDVWAAPVTELVCQDRFFLVLSVDGDLPLGKTLEDSVRSLEQTYPETLAKVREANERTENLRTLTVEPLSDAVHVLQNEMPHKADKEEVEPRLIALEGQMDRVLTHKDDPTPSVVGGGHIFTHHEASDAIDDEDLLPKLNKRLEYYLAYRIKDLQDGLVLRFISGLVLDNSFYMTMAPKDAADTDSANFRYYRLDRENSGRDVFKKALPEQIVEVLDSQRHLDNRLIRSQGTSIDCQIVTDMVLDGVFYTAYHRPSRAATLQEQVELLNKRTADRLSLMQAELKECSASVSVDMLDPLTRRLSQVEASVLSGSVLAVDVRLLQEQAGGLQKDLDATQVETADLTKQMQELDNRLHSTEDQVKVVGVSVGDAENQLATVTASLDQYAIKKEIHPRVDTLEEQMKRVLTLEEDTTYKSSPHYLFSRRDNEAVLIRDEAAMARLRVRLDYYLHYRIKDLKDGSTRTFVKAFSLGDSFYMHMTASAANPNADPRYYRRHTAQDSSSSGGRDVYKNVSEAEKELILATDLGWTSRVTVVDGTRVLCRVVSEMEFEGEIYYVYQALSKATLEDGLDAVESELRSLTHNTAANVSSLRAALNQVAAAEPKSVHAPGSP